MAAQDLGGKAAGGDLIIIARAADTNGSLTAMESVKQPGEGPPLHVHANEDEFIYVLEGRARFRSEDEVFEVPPGAWVFAPRGVPHTWQNVGETPARLLCVFTPPAVGLERLYDGDAEVSLGDAGTELVGPPLAESHPL